MRKLQGLFIAFCLLALASSGTAEDQPAIVRDGIKVTVQIDPQGPNNWIVAAITFINENPYGVDVTGWPVITCEGGDKREGVFVPFSMNPGGTHWVNIQRYQACSYGRIKNIDVEITVKRSNP
jgi:hypothetical protein